MANTYLYKAQPGVGSSIKSTFSGWIKLANDNLTGGIYGQYYNANYNFDICLQNGNLEVADYLVNQYKMRKRTTQKLRDLNAWYHIYVAIDRSLSTAADRTKVYINGERVTDFQSAEDANYTQQTSGSHDGNCKMNNLGGSTDFSRVGIRYDGNEFEGSMSHIYWIDGSVIDIAQFGSTDTTTGEWKINTSPTISSFGQTGFLCLKDGNTITDQSSNSNNFTSSGSGVTKTEDCPSNVFCTLNPLDAYLNYTTLSNGNTTLTGGSQSVNYSMIRGTLGNSTGKYYWEVKAVDNAEIDQVGVALTQLYLSQHASSGGLQSTAWGGKGVQLANGYKVGDGSGSAYMGGFSANEVLCVALDLDNNKITFGKNGQWADGSGNTNQTYANSTAAFTNLTAGEVYLPAHAQRDSAGNNSGTSQYNFGNGYFGTTAISSEGTNASGIGKFEYDVPTGFTALSTKGLNE